MQSVSVLTAQATQLVNIVLGGGCCFIFDMAPKAKSIVKAKAAGKQTGRAYHVIM